VYIWRKYSYVIATTLSTKCTITDAVLQFLQRGRSACNAECCISHGNSVRPSVCLSDTRWYCTQRNEDRITWSSLRGGKNTLVFWYQQWLGATSSFTWNLRSKWPASSEKCRLRPISAYNVSTVRANKKSSIIANMKLTMRFPTSYRWSAHVIPKSPKGCLKKVNL